jgi:excisionase family DNA binding protein
MQFDVRGAAAVMNVPESTIRRWVDEKQLPATGVEGQYRFSRDELLEWATAHKIDLSLDVFDAQTVDSAPVSLSEALAAGGVFHDVPGEDS